MNNDKKETIKTSYNKLANNYDTILSVKKLWGKICCKIIWGFRDTVYAGELLTWIPNDFSGKLLDIPTGTALFTLEKYIKMKNANITCMDYSQNMLKAAKEKFKQNGLNNIVCMQGDIGDLPFEDNTFDLILSMNGFHAFPNKEKAFSEIIRVLKSTGTFIGCYYIKNENKRTDWFINNFYVPKNYFTPPFQNLDEVKNELSKNYGIEIMKTLGSIVYFKCIKSQ
jgi:ubiquinone/menaquinone biosynthesis C-methylase UbiE